MRSVLIVGMSVLAESVAALHRAFGRGGIRAEHLAFRRLSMDLGLDSACDAVEAAARELQPDLVFIFNLASEIPAELIPRLRRAVPAAKLCRFSFDDPYRIEHGLGAAAQWISRMDFCLTCCHESIAEYGRLGVPAFYCPPATDSEYHHPPEHPVQPGYDLGFACQSIYTRDLSPHALISRDEIVRHFQRFPAEFSFALWRGPDPAWPSVGYVGWDAWSAQIASHAKIHLNSHVTQGRFYFNERCTQILGCGQFMLCDRVNGLEEIWRPGMECDYYDSLDEADEKVRHYLVHEEERQAIAARGRERMLQWTYDDMVRAVASICDGDGDYQVMGIPSR